MLSARAACDIRRRMLLAPPTISRINFTSLRVGAKASQRHFYKRMSNSSDEAAAAAAVTVPLGTEKGDSRREPNPDDVLVQYVVLRRDLIDSWPLGSVVTQGCHASVAAVWLSRNDPHTADYCSDDNLDSMHKAISLSPLGFWLLNCTSECCCVR